jgi:urease accessory protein
MTLHMRKDEAKTAPAGVTAQRARGTLDLATKARGETSAIDRLRTSGCVKALFPRRAVGVEAIVINTSGGLTGGDQVSVAAKAGTGSHLTLTTQGAERVYRAAWDVARVDTRLKAEPGATVHWLPQELILFEGGRLRRRLHADLAADAELLLVEPVILGRSAMGERLRDVVFSDRIEIWREGVPLYLDALHLSGDVEAQMARAALAGGAGAMVSLIYVAADAQSHLAALRGLLPDTGGVSLVRPDVLVLRLLAPDSLELRRSLLPILDRLSRDTLPISWRL